MSHELTIRANGKVEMAFAGDIPWHGLGEQLVRGASIEEWIRAAGMDWRVGRAKVRYSIARDGAESEYKEYGSIIESEGKKKWSGQVVLFRSDNSEPLGIVSSDYRIVQPQSVVEFFRDLVGSAGLELETAGTMFGGKKLWAMATVKDATHPVADLRDTMKMNLLLATSLDGSLATTGMWIATRVVCNNMIRIGLAEGDALRVKVRHSSTFNPEAVKKELGLQAAESVFERTMRECREMADKRMKESDVVLSTARLVAPKFDEMSPDEQKKVLNKKPVQVISQLALDRKAMGSEFDGTDGTVWQWLNAVTQYVDHLSGKSNTTTDNRINSAWFGQGAELKERAYAMAKEYTPSLEDVIKATNDSFKKPAASLLDSVIEATDII